MERQAWKLIVLLLLFCYVHSPYVKAQVGNGKQITMEFKNEGLPSIFKRLQKLSGYKVLFIYDEVRSYHSTGKVEKASIEEVLKVIIGKHPLKYVIEGQFINITHKNPQNVISEVKGLKSATKSFIVLFTCTRSLITELLDKLRLKYPLLPTIPPYPTMRLETIRSIIPISCRRYPKSV